MVTLIGISTIRSCCCCCRSSSIVPHNTCHGTIVTRHWIAVIIMIVMIICMRATGTSRGLTASSRRMLGMRIRRRCCRVASTRCGTMIVVITVHSMRLLLRLLPLLLLWRGKLRCPRSWIQRTTALLLLLSVNDDVVFLLDASIVFAGTFQNRRPRRARGFVTIGCGGSVQFLFFVDAITRRIHLIASWLEK